MTQTLLITGGPLFDGIKLYEQGSVLVEGQKVKKVFPHYVMVEDALCVDTYGDLIMPGLVDLHSDSLERSIEKRKGVFFDIDFAILNLDRQLACCGITSFCHAISFADNELGLRSPGEARKCVQKIKSFTRSDQALVKHLTHVRYEVGSKVSYEVIKELIDLELVDMISIMDHTPGQGQFKCMESYVRFHSQEYDLADDEIFEKAREKQRNNNQAWEMVSRLADQVAIREIPMLSHDDDTESKVNLIKAMGINACEFPVTLEAARKAYNFGLDVFMGAPNLIRDSSTNGNLKASDALRHNVCTGLVSDYYPESLFQASFVAARHTGNLEQALQKVTSGPGLFLNRDSSPGFITPGTDADIIIVNRDHEWAHINRSFVRGRTIFQIQDKRSTIKES
ncbi:MAG: alpha-D-ribose 1-methylphosphonate 5-triphosphate diphosphatase [Desulfobacteraceae bacterium]|nr:MAG: alpha-D-ribose 1-methylphosphonate 5-triphosphate diphosphatase [Desulfobacteraceae bacterium]